MEILLFEHECFLAAFANLHHTRIPTILFTLSFLTVIFVLDSFPSSDQSLLPKII